MKDERDLEKIYLSINYLSMSKASRRPKMIPHDLQDDTKSRQYTIRQEQGKTRPDQDKDKDKDQDKTNKTRPRPRQRPRQDN